jgi:hypothetical protein
VLDHLWIHLWVLGIGLEIAFRVGISMRREWVLRRRAGCKRVAARSWVSKGIVLGSVDQGSRVLEWIGVALRTRHAGRIAAMGGRNGS